MKSGACGKERCGEKENEEENDVDVMFEKFRNSADKHVWLEYRRLMEGGNRDMDGGEYNTAWKVFSNVLKNSNNFNVICKI